MGNYNILITNPKGERKRHFEQNQTMERCKQFLEEYGHGPKGWSFQLINSVKKEPTRPEFILIQGFTKDGVLVGQTRAGHRSNMGWYTVKMAKRDLRRQGASYFTRENIWETQEK